jgi:tetratricopeptide (TPR) repeat protein
VLVLQNLGIDRVPVWHYAVVVGISGDEVVLRSGTEERRIEHASRFLREWERGSNWAFVALAPGELPATENARGYIRALAGAEPVLGAAAAERSYRAALERWPNDELVLFASAGQRYAAGDPAEATSLYRRLLASTPQNAAARNNLANVLAERGCRAEALAEARAALAALSPADELGAAVRDTVASLERGPAQSQVLVAECQ